MIYSEFSKTLVDRLPPEVESQIMAMNPLDLFISFDGKFNITYRLGTFKSVVCETHYFDMDKSQWTPFLGYEIAQQLKDMKAGMLG